MDKLCTAHFSLKSFVSDATREGETQKLFEGTGYLISVLFVFIGLDVQVKFLTSELLVDLQYVLTGLFEVTRRVVGLSDPHAVSGAALKGLVNSLHADKHVKDRAHQVECGLNLLLGRIRLDHGGNHSNVVALGADKMSVRDHGDEGIYTSENELKLADKDKMSVLLTVYATLLLGRKDDLH